MSDKDNEKDKTMFWAGAFAIGTAGMAGLLGFSNALASCKQEDTKNFETGLQGGKGLPESGVALARRAFLWGSVWAISVCGLSVYGVWKIIGSPTAEEFRKTVKAFVGTKDRPPTSRVDFENLTDLMKYVSEEWGKESK